MVAEIEEGRAPLTVSDSLSAQTDDTFDPLTTMFDIKNLEECHSIINRDQAQLGSLVV